VINAGSHGFLNSSSIFGSRILVQRCRVLESVDDHEFAAARRRRRRRRNRASE
jgi:hypothetical protein